MPLIPSVLSIEPQDQKFIPSPTILFTLKSRKLLCPQSLINVTADTLFQSDPIG